MFQYHDLSTLNKLPGNPRVIRDKQFQQLCESLTLNRDYFEARPLILSDRTGELVIIAGNQRYEAARAIGMTSVPTFLLKDLTEEREKEIIIRDNVNNGEWDYDILANEWNEGPLSDWGIEFPKQTRLDLDDDNFQAPDGIIPTNIKAGDVIRIGPHILVCGDSTQERTVTQLFEGGGQPILMVTDPPYGVNYDPNWRNVAAAAGHLAYGARSLGKVARDTEADWRSAFIHFPGSVAYVWHAGQHAVVVHTALESCGLQVIYQIIWAKDIHVIGRGDYHFQHEPCWYAVRKGSKHNWQGSRKETSLWEIPRGCKEKTGHSTEKPVECMARPIRNNTSEGDQVYDPFIGSGTTMVAAHKLSRICLGIELEPHWCQVTIDRMLRLDPSLTVTINGLEYQPLTDIIQTS